MNPVFHLYQLQKVDSSLLLNNNRLQSIDKQLKDNIEVKQCRRQVEQLTEKLNILKEENSELENKIQLRRNKLEQSESSLYSGTIKNPKELQDLQKEIIFIKENIGEIEEEQLELMINIEAVEDHFRLASELLQNAINEFAKKNHTFLEEKQHLDYNNSLLLEEREMVVSQVNPSLLAMYNALREKKNGIAVSKVEEQTCSVCGSTITPADCQAARSNSGNVRCPSCGRILYAD